MSALKRRQFVANQNFLDGAAKLLMCGTRPILALAQYGRTPGSWLKHLELDGSFSQIDLARGSQFRSKASVVEIVPFPGIGDALVSKENLLELINDWPVGKIA